MKKQNMPLAMEILKKEQRHTRFWKIAFWVMLVAEIIKNVAGKAGRHNDEK